MRPAVASHSTFSNHSNAKKNRVNGKKNDRTAAQMAENTASMDSQVEISDEKCPDFEQTL
jgi:hypothetical protein